MLTLYFFKTFKRKIYRPKIWRESKMKELFEICPKIQVFELSWCFFRLKRWGRGGGGVGRRGIWSGVKRGVLICQRQTGKNFCLNSVNNGHFSTFRSIFPFVPLENLASSTHFQITFLKSTRLELSSYKAFLTT